MITAELERAVQAALETIEHPGYKRSLADLGMYGGLSADGESLRLLLRSPDADKKAQIALEAQVRKALSPVELPAKLKIRFEVDESLKPGDDGNRIRGVKNLIAVGSGKGGVGKSTVAANLAAAMALRGLRVGLIDADIYGPSLGRMFGLQGKIPLHGDGKNRIFPVEAHGVKLVSFSFMLENDQAVIWRGPMLGKAVEQFLFQVNWGELDYLIIDLPPGTGDVQLSLAQLVEVDGAVIVTTPQNVALQDASRAIRMFMDVKMPILGVIENMSEFICPECGHVSHIFSRNGGESIAAKYSAPLLGNIPITEAIMQSGEEGVPLAAALKEGPMVEAYFQVIDRLAVEIEKYR
ncbi:MAG: Mrp/NBP35 family ATP-binding protein [Leptospirales bacterium]|nr:Mrp/NBP35 family ATP-binding protein [Leptospirales bacterium]